MTFCLFLQQIDDCREQRVGEGVRFEAFEHAELVEHDLALSEGEELHVDAGLDFAVGNAYGTREYRGAGQFVQGKAGELLRPWVRFSRSSTASSLV